MISRTFGLLKASRFLLGLAIQSFVVWSIHPASAAAAGLSDQMDGPIAFLRRDYRHASELLSSVANSGDAFSQLLLAKSHLSSPAEDCSEVKFWLRRAALNGSGEAAQILGDLYAQAKCGPKNPLSALRWYVEAFKRGQFGVAAEIALLTLTESPTPDEATIAKKWLLVGAAERDPRASFTLGEIFLEGYGGTRDPIEALKWFHLSYVWSPIGSDNWNWSLTMRDRVRELLTPAQVRDILARAERESKLFRSTNDEPSRELVH